MASSQFHPQLLSPPGPAVRILIHSGGFSASQLHLVTILSALTFQVFFRVGEWGLHMQSQTSPDALQFLSF